MRRMILFVCIGVALLAGTLAVYSTVFSATDKEFELAFKAYPLEGGLLPVPPSIESSHSGTLAVLRSKSWNVSTPKTAFVYSFDSAGMKEQYQLPALNWENQANCKPKRILNDTQSFYCLQKYNAEGNYESGPYYLLYDKDTQQVTDITPSNVGSLPVYFTRNPYSGEPLYSEEQGLAFFVRDKATGELVLWQGKHEVKDVQRISSTACIGRAFVDGRLTRIVVTEAGKAFAYDHVSGKLEPSVKFSELASVLMQVNPKMLWASGCLMTDSFVMWRENGTRLAFADASGGIFRPKSIDALNTRIDGSSRTEKENEELHNDRSPLAIEAKSLPADAFSRSLLVLPFDDDRLAVIDCDYQRVIIVSPK